jgi:nucleoid-associated protein YgaU
MNPQPAAALKQKYGDLTSAASDLGIKNLQITEQGGKLQVTGTATHTLGKNELWNAIKTHNGWENEVAVDIKVESTDIHGVYTVKAGDSLSKISKYIYGDANKYNQIFEANKDILKNPDVIQPGQKLKIPNP